MEKGKAEVQNLYIALPYYNYTFFTYSYEAEFIQNLIKSGKRQLAKSFNFTFRYIDDVLSLNNSKFSDYINDIYHRLHKHRLSTAMLICVTTP